MKTWFLEKLYTILFPKVIPSFLNLLKDKFLNNILVNCSFSMKRNPQRWHDLIDSVKDQTVISDKDAKELCKLMDVKKYFLSNNENINIMVLKKTPTPPAPNNEDDDEFMLEEVDPKKPWN